MATIIRIIFNNENPPSGIREHEMLQTALARLRIIMLSRVSNCGVAGVVIVNNGSVMPDPDIVDRLGAVPILESVPDWTFFEIKVTAGPIQSSRIQSDDIKWTTGKPAPVLKGIYLSELPINETFLGYIAIKKSSVYATRNPYFSPVSNITFRPLNDEDMEFVVEMVKGYTKTDFERIYGEALTIMNSKLDIFAEKNETKTIKVDGKDTVVKKYPNNLIENLRTFMSKRVLDQPINSSSSSSYSAPSPSKIDKTMTE